MMFEIPASEGFGFAKVSGVATRCDQVGFTSHRVHSGIAGWIAYSIDAGACGYGAYRR